MTSKEDLGGGEKKTEEPLFGLNEHDDEPLNEEEVRLSIYKGVQGNEERLKNTKEDDEWNLHMKCTQEWFIRCSWTNKFLFLEALCKSTTGCFVLEAVLKGIDSILSKDVVESLAHNLSSYDYDVIPADDNRTLTLNQLQNAMNRDYSWFSNLGSSRKICVILRLLRLGGGGLVYHIYKLIDKLFKERKIVNPTPSLGSNSEKQMDEIRLRVKDQSKSQLSKLAADTKSSEDSVNALNEFTQKKLEQLARREAELTEYKKMRGILTEPIKNVKKLDVKETVDCLQILPIWLNRRIISHIDEKTLTDFKKVGKYWGKMIDDYINEKSARKAINGKINKIVGIRPVKEEEKKKMEESEQIEFVVALGTKELLKRKNIPERNLASYVGAFQNIFSRKFAVTPMESSFFYERVCKLNTSVGMLAASTSNNIIQFYSVRTGKRLEFSVYGLESAVTCLALHEDNVRMFIGCKDGSLIGKDIRTNKNVGSFVGHSNAVKWLLTTSSTLLSASQDGTIRRFQLWSGLCLFCIDVSLELNVSSLLVWNENSSLCIMGTVEGVLILVDVESKKFVNRTKLHNAEITQLAHDEELLITGSENGKIRVWDVTKLDNSNCDALNPFYDINVESSVSSLILHKNLIFCGCKNGTIKLISLLEGLVLRTMKISSEAPVLGLDIAEDKFTVKMIIWHEGGIEMRSFSLKKAVRPKKSINKDCLKSRRKTPFELNKQTKATEEVLNDLVESNQRLIEAKSNTYRTTTSCGVKKPFNERCCAVFGVRSCERDVERRAEDVITKTVQLNTPSFNENPIFKN